MDKKRNPSVVVAVSSVLLFVKDLEGRIFPLLGDLSCYPNIDKDVVKALGECGVVDFWEFGRRPSGPTAFQFDVPLSASAISSMDGSSPSDSLSGRGGKRSMIVGLSLSDFVLKKLW